ncbi:MAG TPA: YncE family protein [Pseudolabrys sp.]|nr:YncE family protein [Pseudolabrys sp.]
MKLIPICALAFVCFLSSAFAQQAPWGRADIPISSRDRVYAADQTSNTVSVIDPAANKLLGVIRLGDPVPGALGALYKGQLLVHGLGYSPDSKTLAVVSIASNSVTLIDTATNKVRGTVYVGRSPHEAFFTPNGRELWVTVRGEDYVSVIDPKAMKEIRGVRLANGPGMTIFSTDGRYGFVCSSFTPELAVIDTASHQIIKRVPQASPFCPNIAVSPENDEVWITLKDIGKVQVFRAKPPFEQIALLDTGPITNHVNFANNRNGKFAYLTIGGTNEVKAYRRGAKPELVATIPVGDLPHGIWPSGDGNRVYVALENGQHAVAIDTLSNKVIANIPIGQTTQALVYVPGAVPTGDGTSNLVPLGVAGEAVHIEMLPPSVAGSNARATVAVNSLGVIDLLQIAVAGLKPGQEYQLFLVDSLTRPDATKVGLTKFTANPSGAAIAQAIGPLRTVVATPGSTAGQQPEHRYLVVIPIGSDQAVLQQSSR